MDLLWHKKAAAVSMEICKQIHTTGRLKCNNALKQLLNIVCDGERTYSYIKNPTYIMSLVVYLSIKI